MASPRKKAKKSRNASLKALVGMPMDIIFEIFGHLDPLDLLQLARTTKSLRAILMSRSSLSLWKRVRHAYDQMPDGPDWMSEPLYVSLALDNICYGCGLGCNFKTRPFWNAHLRSCVKCESNLLLNKSNLKKIRSSEILPPKIMDLLVVYNINSQYSWNQVQSWLQEYASLSDSSAKIDWENQILLENARMKQHEFSYFAWLGTRQNAEQARRDQLMKEIKEALTIKLGELGWTEEINKMPWFQRYQLDDKLFKKDPKIFSQAWSLNGHSVINHLKAVQAARLEKEWKELLSSRYKVLQSIYDDYIGGLPADTLLPNIADAVLPPPVHAILTDKRPDFNPTRETFENINLIQILPSIVTDWKTRLEDELIQMVQVSLSESFTKDHFPLATTIFYCSACRITLFYPRVLVHHCSTPESWRKGDPECPAWNSSGNIKFNLSIYQAAIDIVNLFGLDPKVVTVKDMGNAVLQCLDCRKTRQGLRTMNWSRAIDHSWQEHDCRPAMISWKVPGHEGQLLLQASLARENEITHLSDYERPKFMCGRCRQKTTHSTLKEHLLMTHKIACPSSNDILLHPDENHAPMPAVLPETD